MAIIAVARRLARVPTRFTPAFATRPPPLGVAYIDTNAPLSAYAVISANRKRSLTDCRDGAKEEHISADFKLRRTDVDPALASLRGKRSIDEVHWVDFTDCRSTKFPRVVAELDDKDKEPKWEKERSPWIKAVDQSTTGDQGAEAQHPEPREDNQADSSASTSAPASTAPTAAIEAADNSPASIDAVDNSPSNEQVVAAPKEVEAGSSAVTTEADKVDSNSPAPIAAIEAADNSPASIDAVDNSPVNEQVVAAPKEVEAGSSAVTTEANKVDSSSPASPTTTEADDEAVQLDHHVKLYHVWIEAWIEANQLDGHVVLYKEHLNSLPDDDESSDYAPEPSDDECECLKNGLVDCIVDHSDPDSDDESIADYDFWLDLEQDPANKRARRKAEDEARAAASTTASSGTAAAAAPPVAAPPFAAPPIVAALIASGGAAQADDDSSDDLFPRVFDEVEMEEYADWVKHEFEAEDLERRQVLKRQQRERRELRAAGRSNFSTFSTPAPFSLLAQRLAASSVTTSPAFYSNAVTATTSAASAPSVWQQNAPLATGSSGFAASPAAFGQRLISPARSPAVYSAAAATTTSAAPAPSVWQQNAPLPAGPSGFAASPAGFGQILASPALNDADELDEADYPEAEPMDLDDDEDLAPAAPTREGPFALPVPAQQRDAAAPPPAFYSDAAVVAAAPPSIWQQQAQVPAGGSSGSNGLPSSLGAFRLGRMAAPAPAPDFAPSRGFSWTPTSTAFGLRN